MRWEIGCSTVPLAVHVSNVQVHRKCLVLDKCHSLIPITDVSLKVPGKVYPVAATRVERHRKYGASHLPSLSTPSQGGEYLFDGRATLAPTSARGRPGPDSNRAGKTVTRPTFTGYPVTVATLPVFSESSSGEDMAMKDLSTSFLGSYLIDGGHTGAVEVRRSALPWHQARSTRNGLLR